MTRGVLVIVSSPSGAGKTTLTRRLLAEFGPQLEFSVSYTTRPMRPGEVDGRDYWFVDARRRSSSMVERGEFAEYAWVHQNRYGTARAPIDAALAAGRDVIFDVDWQGGRHLSARWPEDSLKIFILPPDLETLERRLRAARDRRPGGHRAPRAQGQGRAGTLRRVPAPRSSTTISTRPTRSCARST